MNPGAHSAWGRIAPEWVGRLTERLRMETPTL
jgi:hypothetical protein